MTVADFESSTFRLARRNRGLLVTALGMILAGGAGLAFELWSPVDPNAPSSSSLPALLAALVAGPLGLILLRFWLLQNPLPRLRPTTLRLDGGDLWIGAPGRAVPRRQIREGLLLQHADGGSVVRLELTWPRLPVELRPGDRSAGEALLAALALDVTRNRARFQLAPVPVAGLLQFVAYAALFYGAYAAVLGDAVLAAFSVVSALALAFVLRWPAHVDVGSDGLTIRKLGHRSRFVAHEAIEFVYRYGLPQQQDQGVELLLRGGAKVTLPTRVGFTSEITNDRTNRCLGRITEARSQWRGAVKHLTALLDSSNREPRAWVHALRESARGGHPHRSVRIDPDELWSVLEDPAAAASARGGAAIALAARSDESVRERIRIAARATAADDVRRAIELAADDGAEEEALAAAVAPLLKPRRA